MSGEKKAKKGIESLEKQLDLHRIKLKKAEREGNLGLTAYYEKEMQHFEETKEKLKKRIMPKKRRKK